MQLTKYAIIVAGGKGLRMGAEIPKQFLLLAGLPVLMHTVKAFADADRRTQIIVVLPQDHIQYWEALCEQYAFSVQHTVVTGGAERFYSVRNGLASIEADEALVAIHDGVRPLVSTEVINRCYQHAQRFGSAIPCITVPDSVRTLDGDKSTPIDRNAIRLIQTPQTFRLSVLADAYNIPYSGDITDDASAVERTGRQVSFVLGNRENIKITSPEDLSIAFALLSIINADRC